MRCSAGQSDKERTHKLARALSKPLPPQEIPQCGSAVPSKSSSRSPADVNEHLVPIRHTALEKELTVGSGIRCVSGAQFGDGTDVGYNRMNFRWGNVGTFQISPGSPYVAGDERSLSHAREGAADVLLRRAAGLHAARGRAHSTM